MGLRATFRDLALPVIVPLLALVAVFAAAAATPGYETLKDRAEDLLLGLRRPAPADLPVVVVDIDRAALAEFGPWPWSRDRLAAVVDLIAAAGPKALGLDILMDGADERSPAALARALARASGRPEIAAMASSLVDGDLALIGALRRGPSVLGLALDPEGMGNAPPAPAVLVGGDPDLAGIWHAPGAIGPTPAIAAAASGFGIMALPGDNDGRIRHAPLLVSAAGQLRPGLAVELVRLATDSGAYVVDGDQRQLRVGESQFALTSDGMLRLRPSEEARHRDRAISVIDVVRDEAARARLGGAIVLLGTSAPEIGGLRAASSGDLVPSVQIQADAVAQMLAGDQPHHPDWLGVLELLALVATAAAAALAANGQPPLRAAWVTAALVLGWFLFTFAALDVRQLLVDPISVPIAAVAAYALFSFLAASRTRVREAAIRRRFEQQLPAAVVRRLLDAPELLKLEGEARLVTALFTDIEGFTSMTERAGPRRLVQMLDRYFEGVVHIVIEHGGMVEKIVGDGLHAIFNAPLDLDDHAGKALECARAIVAFSDRFRAEGDPAALGFGRTRIGIETGEVVVGDVGGGRHLDYTAHGDAMNTAARLEAANKELGSTICIGPGAAARLDHALLRPLGRLDVRGRSEPLAVFEPWPARMSHADRQAFIAAWRLAEIDRPAAMASLQALAARYPQDKALARLAGDVTGRSAAPP